MICCLNPDCIHPKNQTQNKFCQHCGYPLEARLINRFEIIDVIGQGGFGRTYLARDTQKLNETCVLKQLIHRSQGSHSSKRAEAMFYAEAKQLQALGSHPQIPTLLAFFIHNDQQYLVQELIQGKTLKQELTFGKFSEQNIRCMLADLLPVLDFIHQQNVIHRDIKPENIMRCPQKGKLILIDFGISKTFTLETLTKTGTIVGSHGYSAKEQIIAGKATPATDLFSLGVSCFHLMTQVSPMELSVNYGFSWVEQWRSHLTQHLTPEFAALMDRLIAVEAGDRYASAQTVLTDLANLPPIPNAPLPETSLQSQSKPDLSVTIPQNGDPFVTLENTPSVDTIRPSKKFATRSTPNRRQFLKYFGIGTLGGLGAIALWKLSEPRTKTTTSVKPPVLKGREMIVQEYNTASISAAGDIQQQATLDLELTREHLGDDLYLDLAIIPAGNFLMGSSASESQRDDDESPRHSVSLKAFLIGIYEITQRQWQAVAQFPKIDIELRANISEFEGSARPVERVTWFEAVEFCQRLAQQTGQPYRLPSEAEWEYACRAGSNSTFSYGPTVTAALANFDASTPYKATPQGEFRKKTTDVGSFFANSWGLYDMHGNVMEWCGDNWHDSYDGAPTDNDAWVTDGNDARRVLRGGSWYDQPRFIRSANRSKKRPTARDADVGFRVVCDLPT